MLKLTLRLRPGESERRLLSLCEQKLKRPVKYFRILKKSLDAREEPVWVYNVECSDRAERPEKREFEQVRSSPRVYIAGMGPAGLFCALRLLDYGIRPILLERGKCVEERTRDVEAFRQNGAFDPKSNVQFGEGGAGTFSDGKLNTQTNSPYHRDVLGIFVAHGAPEEIAYLGKPHVGSDRLQAVVAAIRRDILARGGEVRFQAKLEDICLTDGRLSGVVVNGVREDADELVLAIGHSARDTFEMLLSRGFLLQQKEFAVGVRVEHLQSKISEAQYGKGYLALPPADYKLVSHAGERAAFTFCMCPGGVVIPAASEEGGVVTNGMSNYLRDERNANSALIVQVREEDFGSSHPLAGVWFQRRLEQAAYQAGGGDFRAPIQLMGDFLSGKESYWLGEVTPSYSRGTAFAPLDSYLPPPVTRSLRAAIPDMDRRLSGFSAYEAVLTGVESRTSSPVRIVRGEDMQAAGKEGIYPCGEGCGYAGGIASAAADGIRVAEHLTQKYL